MISSRRVALVSLVLVFGATACGSQSPSTSGTTPGTEVTVPAPTTTLPVIHLAAGGRNASGGAAGAAPMAAESTTDSKMMPIMAATEFVYDGDLPALDGTAASWFFARGQKPDPARIAALAASLGVTGDVREVPADQGGGWAVGPADYSGPVLSVGSDGMLSWWLTAAPMPMIAGCAIPADTSVGGGSSGSTGALPPSGTMPVEKVGPSAPDCTPQPPQNVPTADEALAKAKELFASWGYDLSSYEFDTPYADEWSASVNAWLTVDGMRTPISLSVGFGENGTVTWASGQLATAERGPDFPTVGAAAGLQRLKDQQGQWAAYDTGIATREVAPAASPETAVPVDEGAAGTASTGTGVATPDIAIAPPVCTDAVDSTMVAPDCTVAPAEPITVHLNSVKVDLTMVWADDSTIWLLPAYTFGSADGGFYTVMAVDDAYVQQPADEPATTVPVGTEPVNVPATGAIAPTPASAP